MERFFYAYKRMLLKVQISRIKNTIDNSVY
jgi:hypothetical protein